MAIGDAKGECGFTMRAEQKILNSLARLDAINAAAAPFQTDGPPPPQQEPVASQSVTLQLPCPYNICNFDSDLAHADWGTVTVTVNQINKPTLGIRNVKGTPRLVVGVDLVFVLSDSNGPIANATVRESVQDPMQPVVQNPDIVPLDSQGRGADLVSNYYPSPIPGQGESDKQGQLAAFIYFNRPFTTNQILTLSITLPGGNKLEYTQQRSLTNTIEGAPRVAPPIHGYTFTMKPATIRAIP